MESPVCDDDSYTPRSEHGLNGLNVDVGIVELLRRHEQIQMVAMLVENIHELVHAPMCWPNIGVSGVTISGRVSVWKPQYGRVRSHTAMETMLLALPFFISGTRY